MENNCHIPDLVQAFRYVVNGGLNLVLYLDKLLTYDNCIKFHYIDKNKVFHI